MHVATLAGFVLRQPDGARVACPLGLRCSVVRDWGGSVMRRGRPLCPAGGVLVCSLRRLFAECSLLGGAFSSGSAVGC